MLGPYYVGDSPTGGIEVTLTRDAELVDLDDYTAAAVVLYGPTGSLVTWGSTPTLGDEGVVTIPAPSATPFATAGSYRLFIRLTAATGLVETFLAGIVEVLSLGNAPVLADVTAYLGATSWSDDEIDDALAAETAAQRAVCRVGSTYPADLREALLRRVARNLAMRGQPSSVPTDSDIPSFLPTVDPEVRRLERPYRKYPVG